MTLRVESSVSEDYERLFFSDPGATVFHHPDFLRASRAIFRGNLEVWWLGDDCACPFVIKRKGPYKSASSLGYGCYGGPVGNNARFSEFMKLSREAGFSRLEIVDFRNRLPANGFILKERVAHILQLPDSPEKLPALYSSMRRRSLRKEFLVSVGADPQEFYLLHRETFASLKTWVTPEKGIDALLRSSVARFYTARSREGVAGVLLVLSHGPEAMWWISGRKPWEEGVMTHLLHRAMVDAIEEGKSSFNLGGTDAPGPGRFKESLGARPYSYRSLAVEKGTLALVRRIRSGF